MKKNKSIGEIIKNNFFVSLLVKLWKHPKGRIGLIIVALLAICAIFAFAFARLAVIWALLAGFLSIAVFIAPAQRACAC